MRQRRPSGVGCSSGVGRCFKPSWEQANSIAFRRDCTIIFCRGGPNRTASGAYTKDSGSTYEYRTLISKAEDSSGGNLGYVDVETKDYSGTTLTKERHYFHGSAKVPTGQPPYDYSRWKDGKEWKTERVEFGQPDELRLPDQSYERPEPRGLHTIRLLPGQAGECPGCERHGQQPGLQRHFGSDDAVGARGQSIAVKTQITIAYDDTNRTVTTTSDRDSYNDNLLQKKSVYDGLGRTWRAGVYEGSTLGWSIVDTEFDALGRACRTSNPYRASGELRLWRRWKIE